MNQKNIIGPKERPITLVPKRCIKNKIEIIPIHIGSTGVDGFITSNPSIADVTVIAGVIIPSATSVAAPIIATTYKPFQRYLCKRA